MLNSGSGDHREVATGQLLLVKGVKEFHQKIGQLSRVVIANRFGLPTDAGLIASPHVCEGWGAFTLAAATAPISASDSSVGSAH